ncbi:glycerol dehydrogenase (plasmid) [Bartonella sp. HY329]|uniref:glycerol dehydrogenase n=1 Tax=unclassified Bartonella TaxID=2645622 RepID=UPI0021C5C52A|nr:MULTISPECIES: glycerol dehydrogenase [unclassified Bartonella]UXM96518.1 glycerol dehydrogenase [Bartonella sp. HY329]UXN10841.1 glycerol dehydrogenase [Bartonella sp. HY328]
MITTTIFPSRYIQGPNALSLLGEELARLGKKVLLLEDPFVAKDYNDAINQGLGDKIQSVIEVFTGECCDEEIDRLAKTAGIDVVAGIGGGKTLDTAKAVAHTLKVPVVIVPTLASTDAPCSALSVIYTPKGEFSRYLFLPKNPDLVLVDSAIIAKAPVRFLAAGIGDALATWFEAESCRLSKANNMTGRPGSNTAYGLARLCFDTLLEYGSLAYQSCEAGVPTPALEKIIEANTLLSGLGFESGGLAACHAIHNGLTILPQTHHYWHGEKVTIGVLASLILTDKDAEMIDLIFDFCELVNLPTTLADIGLGEVSDADLMKAAEAATVTGETIHNELGTITAQMVFNALRAADAIGRERKGE